jgi:hypothetical protein
MTLHGLWHRDQGTCWLRGGPVAVPGDVDPLDDAAPTRDHVQPRAEGGADGGGNLRLAHRACNAARGRGAVASPYVNERIREIVARGLRGRPSIARDVAAERLVAAIVAGLGFDPPPRGSGAAESNPWWDGVPARRGARDLVR